LALLICIGFAVSATKAIAAVGTAAFVYVIAIAVRFARQPDTTAQKAVDTAAGLWVFVCYMTAGFLPLLGRM